MTTTVAPATSWITTTVQPTGGFVVGRYQCEELLGTGLLGHAYRARLSTPLGFESWLAVTILRAELQGDADLLARLAVAATQATQLDGGGAVRPLDLLRADNCVLLVQEFAHGVDLGRLLSALAACRDPIPWEAVLCVALDVAETIGAAHRRRDLAADGVVHLCLAPQKIMIDRSGRLRVLDVGLLAPLVSPDWIEPSPALARFVAPETRRGRLADARADVYSLCALVEALLERADRGVPPVLRPIVARGMCTRPDARWPSLDAVLAELRPLLRGRGGAPRLRLAALARQTMAQRRRRGDPTGPVALPSGHDPTSDAPPPSQPIIVLPDVEWDFADAPPAPSRVAATRTTRELPTAPPRAHFDRWLVILAILSLIAAAVLALIVKHRP